MPLTRYTFKPGINKEGTSYSNEGNWFDADKIRFRAGRPEKIGGWVKKSINSFLGSARKLHQWISLVTDKFISLGTPKDYNEYISWQNFFQLKTNSKNL